MEWLDAGHPLGDFNHPRIILSIVTSPYISSGFREIAPAIPGPRDIRMPYTSWRRAGAAGEICGLDTHYITETQHNSLYNQQCI